MRSIKLTIVLLGILCLSNKLFGQSKTQKIQALIEANVISLNPFSGSVLVAQNDSIVYTGAFGYSDIKKKLKNTIETKYFIGSITKQFTTVAILQLVEQGKISLEDKMSKWIPQNIGSEKITIHHLLSHQSGLRRDSYFGYHENVTSLDRVLSVKDDTLLFEPGTKSEYSSVGFHALTYILEKVSGLRYEVYFEQNIFIPAGLINTGVRKSKNQKINNLAIGICKAPDEYGVDDFDYAPYFDSYSLGGGGSIYSTVNDMFKFHLAVENGTILSLEMVELMKKRWELPKEPRPFNTYGWEVWDYSKENDEYLIYGFAGRIYGYKSMHRYYIKENIVVIVLTNSEFSERSRLGYSIKNILLEQDYKLPEKAPEKLPINETMIKHLGVYDFPSEETTVEIKIVNDRMTLTSHGDNPMYIYPKDDYTFYSDLIPLKITFEKTEIERTQMLEFNFGDEMIKIIERKK